MHTRHHRRVFLAAAIAVCAASASAQVTETPVTFDSAGRVRVLSPALVSRLGLQPPMWPVGAGFEEARLYSISTGGYVIVAERPAGVIDRYALSIESRETLMRAIGASMARSGSIVAESGFHTASEPARGAFVLNQMFLTAFIYAPAAATLTRDAKGGTAVWLLATGGSYFGLTQFAKNRTISRAQNHLASDGGLRGAFIANGVLKTFGVDMNDDIAVGTGLAGALAGAVTGYRLGRGWTDGEAYAASSGSTLLGLAALGVTGMTDALGDDSRERVVWGSIVASGITGYALGPLYPRRAGYRVTSGDIGMLHLTGALGVMAASIPFADVDDVNERAAWASVTAGLLGGVFIGDLVYARPYDHTGSETRRVLLGTIGGGLVGAAAAVLSEPDARVGLTMIVGGAIAGTIVGHRLVSPALGGLGSSASAALRPARWQINPGAVAGLVMKTGAVQPILRVTF